MYYKTDLHLWFKPLTNPTPNRKRKQKGGSSPMQLSPAAAEWAAPLWFNAPPLPLIPHNAQYEHQQLGKIKHFTSLLSHVCFHVIKTENIAFWTAQGIKYIFKLVAPRQCRVSHFLM